jgi:CBS domain containing-hemolysin-like protein
VGRYARRRAGRSPAPLRPSIETALGLVLVVVLVGANALFVAAEFAIVAVDRSRLEHEAASGDERAGRTLAVARRLSFHLSGAQLGITISSLVLGFVAEPAIAGLLEPVLGTERRGLSVVLALLLATVFQMVAGELIPKNVAIARPAPVASALATPMRIYGAVFGPVIGFLNGAANWTVRRFGIEPKEELTNVRSLGELELLILSSGESGLLAPEAATLLTRSIRFRDKTADDAMIPRVEVAAVPSDATVADLVAESARTGFSRFPVHGGTLDDIVGVVHVKAVLAVPPEERASTAVTHIMGEAFVVPESRLLTELMVELRDRGSHLALVVDEYGGTAGIVTLEDLLEEIVGEIDDEHDRPAPVIRRAGPSGALVVPGALHRDEARELVGLEIPEGGWETLAGFILELMGQIPEPGEWVTWRGWRFQVEDRDGLRVATVRIVPPPGHRTPGPVRGERGTP